MHRPSALENPSVPLAHHQTDATHITPGVLRAGVSRNGIGVEGSWFRGEEPDENRLDLDLGALDSWALRGTWKRGPWQAQVSGGHLNSPEWVEPLFDVTRLTASVGYTSADGRLASMLLWGQNREVHGVLDAFVLETTARLRERDTGTCGRSRREEHPRGERPPSGRVPAFSSDLARGRADGGLRARRVERSGRTARDWRRRDRVLRAGESADQLRLAGVISCVPAISAGGAGRAFPLA